MSTARRCIKLVVSDFHLSRGRWLKDGRRNPLEDFHQDQALVEFLDHYSTGEFEHADVELVINGDFFDPLAVIPLPDHFGHFTELEFPLEVEEEPAVTKFKTILEGHPKVTTALKQFLGRGKRIIMRYGNHDAALLWPAVQALLRSTLAPPAESQLSFQMEAYVFDRIRIEHGHQHEIIHEFDERKMFIDRADSHGVVRKIQNLPFGSFFVLSFLNRMKFEKPYINQVYPLGTYIRINLLMRPIEAIWDGMRSVWFFFKMRLITHPMRFARLRKTLKMVPEIIRRPKLEDIAERLLSGPHEERNFDVLIMGHNHQAAYRVFANGTLYINTGTWTPITSLDFQTLGRHVLRTYALIEYIDGKPRPSLKIWHGNRAVTEEFA